MRVEIGPQIVPVPIDLMTYRTNKLQENAFKLRWKYGLDFRNLNFIKRKMVTLHRILNTGFSPEPWSLYFKKSFSVRAN